MLFAFYNIQMCLSILVLKVHTSYLVRYVEFICIFRYTVYTSTHIICTICIIYSDLFISTYRRYSEHNVYIWLWERQPNWTIIRGLGCRHLRPATIATRNQGKNLMEIWGLQLLRRVPFLKHTAGTWKWIKWNGWNTVLVSFWDGLFSGATLALGGYVGWFSWIELV